MRRIRGTRPRKTRTVRRSSATARRPEGPKRFPEFFWRPSPRRAVPYAGKRRAGTVAGPRPKSRRSRFRSAAHRLEVLPVEPGDELHVDPFGADALALVVVRAVAEAAVLRRLEHVGHALGGLDLALGQGGELGDLGSREEHRRAVRAPGHARAAADALGGVHGVLGL